MSRNRTSAKKAGTAWESAIVDALIRHGWPHAERRRLNGIQDRGDIAGVPGVCIEAKNTRDYDPCGALDEAHAETVHAGADVGVAWIKRKRRTTAEDGLVVMDGSTFMALLKEAGW